MKLKLLAFSLLIGFNSFSQTKLSLRPGAEGKDATIFSRTDQVAVNDGNSVGFHALAWTWNNDNLGAGAQRGLIQFDLSQVPANATIIEATLKLYADSYKIDAAAGHSTLSGSNAASLKRITAPWQENTVTWANQPATSGTGNIVLAASTSGTQNYALNVINDVKDMLSNPASNNGWMFQLSNEQAYRGMFFGSSDASNADFHPLLEIFYTLPCEGTKEFQPAAEGIDAQIFSRSDAVAKNEGNSPYMHAFTWTWNADGLGTGSYRSLIKFDLSSIPATSPVAEATLTLFADNFDVDASAGAGHTSLTHSNAAYLLKVTQAWNESTVTWANQPSFVTSDAVALAQSTSGSQNYTLNVLTHVKAMVSNPANNFGWVLREEMETTYSGLFFASSDNVNAALRPKLVVKYTCPVVTSTHEVVAIAENLMVYPNPNNSGELSFSEISSGKITDLSGNTVLIFSNAARTDISALSKGIYLVQTLKGKNQKLIIN